MAQAGYFVTDDLEVFGRWEYGDADNFGVQPAPDNANKLNSATAGINYFINGKNLKFTTDFTLNFQPLNDPWQSSGTDMADAPDKYSFAIRAQLQILF